MAQYTLVVDSVDSKEINTKRGPGTLYIIKAGGKEFSTFNRETAVYAAQFRGQQALLTADEDTRTVQGRDGLPKTFTNYRLQAIAPAGAAETSFPAAAQPAPAPVTPGGSTAVEQAQAPTSHILSDAAAITREQTIARAVAFKGAVELISSGQVDIAGIGDVKALAESFEPWLMGEETAQDAEPVTFATQPAEPLAARATFTNTDDVPF